MTDRFSLVVATHAGVPPFEHVHHLGLGLLMLFFKVSGLGDPHSPETDEVDHSSDQHLGVLGVVVVDHLDIPLFLKALKKDYNNEIT